MTNAESLTEVEVVYLNIKEKHPEDYTSGLVQ